MTSLLTFSLLYRIKQIGSMLPRVCSVMDHRRHQNPGAGGGGYSHIIMTGVLVVPFRG